MDGSDEQVWRDVVSGDSARFGVVWDRHRDRVFRHLLQLGERVTDAEDSTALVFLEAWRRRAAVRFVDGSLAPWLLVTAQHVHRNGARSRRRYGALLARLPPPPLAPDPAESLAGRDSATASHVREILAARSILDRRLLALTVLEEFTVAQAAAATGLTESAARMRLSRLRARLRPPTPEEGST